MKKIKLQKKKTKLTLGQLLMDDGDEMFVEVWADPSKKLVFDLLGIVLLSSEELQDLNETEQEEIHNDYLRAVSLIFLDSNIDGLDFSSPEGVRESMTSVDLPWGFMYDLTVHYTSWLLTYHEKIKKVLRLSKKTSDSGLPKKPKE